MQLLRPPGGCGKRMIGLSLVLIGTLLAGGVFLAARGSSVFAETFGDYLGWKACAECHEDVASSWQKTRHALAFEHLKNDGKEGVPGCVRCHVVRFDEDGGFIDMDLTPELAGVQCESCHGPGTVSYTHLTLPTN